MLTNNDDKVISFRAILKNNLEKKNHIHDRKVITEASSFQTILKQNLSLLNHKNNYYDTSFPNSLLMNDVPKKSEKIIKNHLSDTKNNSYQSDFNYSETLSEVRPRNENELDLDTFLNKTNENKDNIKNKCIDCGSDKLVEDLDSGSLVCSICGITNEQYLDYGPEWKQYNDENGGGETVGRCSGPVNVFFPKSSQGTLLTGAINHRLKQKQRWNSTVYKEDSLNEVFEMIRTICVDNNIPKKIEDTSKYLYKKNISDHSIIIRGKNRKSIVLAIIADACKINKSPRTVSEIASYGNLTDKKVNKGIKQYEEFVRKDNQNLDDDNANMVEDYIRRHCETLKIDKDDINLAVTIANNCYRLKLVADHSAQFIAAGAIMVMIEYTKINIDKKKIAVLFGTTDVTVMKVYKKIITYSDALIDDERTTYIINKFKING